MRFGALDTNHLKRTHIKRCNSCMAGIMCFIVFNVVDKYALCIVCMIGMLIFISFFVQLVNSGYRFPPPPGCPRMVYKMMIQCW